jgi:hypothetical protein
VLEDVRVHGWNVELRLRIPLDDTPPANTSIRPSHTDKRRRTRSTRNGRAAKEAVSSNDHLRSIGEPLRDRTPAPYPRSGGTSAHWSLTCHPDKNRNPLSREATGDGVGVHPPFAPGVGLQSVSTQLCRACP